MKHPIQTLFLTLPMMLSSLCLPQVKNLTMAGIVTDKISSRPVEGARVTIIGNKGKADATTDSEGAFVVSLAQGVKEGDTVRIQIEKAGYKPYEELLAVSSEIPLRVPLESIRSKTVDHNPAPPVPQERTTEIPPSPNDPWVQTFNGGGCENGVPDVTHTLTLEQAIRLTRQTREHSRMWGLQGVTATCESNQLGSFATLDFPSGVQSSGSVVSFPPPKEATAIKFWLRWDATTVGGTVKWVISEGCISTNLDVPVPEIAAITDLVGPTPTATHTLATLTPFSCNPKDMVAIKIGRYGDQDTSHSTAHLVDLTVEYKTQSVTHDGPPILQECPGGSCAVSVGQQGGITAGTVVVAAPPRRIPPELRDQVIEVLKQNPMKVSVCAFMNDAEGFQFAKDWYDVFKAANWQMQEPEVATLMAVGSPESGVVVYMKGEPIAPGASQGLAENDPQMSVAKALKLVGLPPFARRSLDFPDEFVRMIVGPRP
jgi:hypothetical protein